MTTVIVASQPVAIDAKHCQTVDTVISGQHAIVYNSRLSQNAKFLHCVPGAFYVGGQIGCAGCSPLCNILNWEKLNVRSYVRVYENRFEWNYATTVCCGACVQDWPGFLYFDKMFDGIGQASSFTPFHFCYFVECTGAVMFNACPFPFCCIRTYFPGIENVNQLVNALQQSREVFRNGARLPGNSLQPQAPVVVQMA